MRLLSSESLKFGGFHPFFPLFGTLLFQDSSWFTSLSCWLACFRTLCPLSLAFVGTGFPRMFVLELFSVCGEARKMERGSEPRSPQVQKMLTMNHFQEPVTSTHRLEKWNWGPLPPQLGDVDGHLRQIDKHQMNPEDPKVTHFSHCPMRSVFNYEFGSVEGESHCLGVEFDLETTWGRGHGTRKHRVGVLTPTLQRRKCSVTTSNMNPGLESLVLQVGSDMN